ncbi:MAG: efflux RND transporter periplasmic adaptor subunit [Myxococcota bacterium]
MKAKIAIPSLLVLAAAGGVVWYLTQPAAASVDANQRAITVEKGVLVETAAASGKIEPHTQVEVKSRTAGEVVEILVKEGQEVKVGDLMVRLDPGDAERELQAKQIALTKLEAQLTQSKAALTVAQLQASEARANAKVQADGTQLGVVAGTSSRTAKSQASVAAATVTQRQADIGGVEASIESAKVDVELAQRKLDQTKIFAPITGTVLAVNVEIGTIVSSALTNVNGGSGVVTLADLSDLRVIGQIDEAQIGKVAPQQAVAVRVDAYPDRTFTGTVERVSPLGVSTSNVVTFDVEIVVTDAQKSLLKSGMSADVEITTKKTDGAVLVPLTAISSKGPARFVKLANGEERRIKTGASDGSRIQVVDGLKEGDKILPVAVTAAADTGAPKPSSPFPMGGGRGGGGGGGRRPSM